MNRLGCLLGKEPTASLIKTFWALEKLQSLELGWEGFIWDETTGFFNYELPNLEVESHAHWIVRV